MQSAFPLTITTSISIIHQICEFCHLQSLWDQVHSVLLWNYSLNCLTCSSCVCWHTRRCMDWHRRTLLTSVDQSQPSAADRDSDPLPAWRPCWLACHESDILQQQNDKLCTALGVYHASANVYNVKRKPFVNERLSKYPNYRVSRWK